MGTSGKGLALEVKVKLNNPLMGTETIPYPMVYCSVGVTSS